MLRVMLLAVALLAAPSAQAAAQDTPPSAATDSLTEVRLRDGTVMVGRVVESTEARIVLVTRSGARVEIPRGEIVSMRAAVLREDGQVWTEDANVSRLFFTSTGRPLPKGEGYVSSYWLFFPFVGYGVTDWFTIAGGTPILPGVIGDVFYLAPKLTFYDRDKLSISAGALSFFVTEAVDEGNAGLLYGVGTYGSTDNAVTFGAGWFYAQTDGWSGTANEPVFMLGGERRVSRRVKLITENWFAVNPGVNGLFSGGLRFVGDRLSADFALAGASGTEAACCLPMLNFVWSFGGQAKP